VLNWFEIFDGLQMTLWLTLALLQLYNLY